MAIACVDWREADTGALAAVYADEIDRWSTVLGWDTATSWEHIELGRRLGTVPGLIALDADGALAGWTFYLVHRGILQIGGFVAVSEQATTALVDGIFASEAAARAQSVTVFVFTEAPGLTNALAQRGLTVGVYHYLSKPLPGQSDLALGGPGVEGNVSSALRQWQPGDMEAVAALLRIAYPGADGARPFAPGGTGEEWREYVGQLVGAAGCGMIMPEGCYVAADGPDRLSGIVLVTRLATATAHIAQLAVDPRTQRRGLGRLLVSAACATAGAARCDRITLLVEGGNSAARRLYEASGFQTVARFVSAGGDQPLRFSSLAMGRGAVMRP